MPRITHCAALLLSCSLPAQVFVVDAQNRPGTHFTDLATACNAAPDGATLDVRPGFYGTFHITGKGMRVLAQPGAVALVPLHSSCGISSVPANKTVVVRGLQLASANNSPAPVRFGINGAAGPVLLEGIEVLAGQQVIVHATACASLLLKHVRGNFFFQMNLTGCHTVIEASAVGGPGSTTLDAPGILCTDGTLQVIDSTVQGMLSFNTPTRSGIELVRGNLRLLGTTAVSCGRSWTQPPTFAVSGTGTVRSEPGVSFPFASAPFAPTLSVTQRAMPALTTVLAGGQATARLHSPIGHLGLVVIGLPGPLLSIPGLADPLWLDPATFGSLVIGTVGTGSPVSAGFPVPNTPVRGIRATWQAITWDLGSEFQISNPSFVLLP